MGKELKEIARILTDSSKKVQLIYAFNGVGKTRLSREFKDFVAPKHYENEQQDEDTGVKVLYYNAFTEDLFNWDNDLDGDTNRRLIIRPNGFTDWVLKEEGQTNNIITYFQHYTNEKLTPRFSEDYREITFSIERGNADRIDNIKISRGEESCLVWCVFFSLMKEIVEVLSVLEPADRSTNQFDDLEYIFIDDPVSSLDENHLIELAVNIAEMIADAPECLNFIITTHNPLFYNVLYNELGLKKKNNKNSPCAYMLRKNDDGAFELLPKFGDSNKSFSYHLFLIQTIEDAIKTNSIQRYHFMLLRNLYEKTANFLGYTKWTDLLPDDKQTYYKRIIQFTSHSTLSNEMMAEPTDSEKQIVRYLLKNLIDNSRYKQEEQQ